MWFVDGRRCAVAALALIAPALVSAERLVPSEALDRYLKRESRQQLQCSDSDYAVQIDASVPALKKRGTMTGFKRITRPGHAIYRGLRFTGDSLVKTQVIARFLAHETNPPEQAGDVSISRVNYRFEFDKVAEYNGQTAYVFRLRPLRKRASLFRGELWLDAETAVPLRLWGDLVKSPSIFVRSFRFVEDYEMSHGCNEPLRSLLTAQTRIAGTVEMTIWQHPSSDNAETMGAANVVSH